MLIGISGKIGSGKDTVGKYIQYLLSNEYPRHTFEEFKTMPRWINANDWQIKKYADKLKEIVCLLIGCTREQLEDIDFKNKELGEEWNLYQVIGPRYKDRKMVIFKVYTSILDAQDFLSNNLVKYEGRVNLIPLDWSEREEEKPFIKTVKLTPRKLLQLLGTECGRNIIHPNIWVNALFADYKSSTKIYEQYKQIAHKYLPNWIITDVRFPNEADAILERDGILIRLTRTTEVSKEVAYHPSEIALDDYNKFTFIIDNKGTEEELYAKVYNILKQTKLLLN